MNDLYRIDYSQDASDGVWVKAHTESLVHLGVLVKVEPSTLAAVLVIHLPLISAIQIVEVCDAFFEGVTDDE